MSIHTSSRARSRQDRAGDPLDGLVNMFDLGVVLAVAFLLAGLSALHLTNRLIKHTRTSQSHAITAAKSQTIHPIHLKPGQRVVGHGVKVGSVYRLRDGQLVYVAPKRGHGR